MSGRLDKIVSMFNALDDEDKNYVLTEIVYPEVPELESVAEAELAAPSNPGIIDPGSTW